MPHPGTEEKAIRTSVSPGATANPNSELAELTPARPLTGVWATFRSLRHRDYRLYFIGQLVSLVGTWTQTTALQWLAFELTGMNQWTALVTVTQAVPTFLLGAWSGALADRLTKRSILLLSQSCFLLVALGLAALVLAGKVAPWHLLVLTLAHGFVQAVDLPTRLAFMKDLVGREDLINAVALNSLMFNLARFLGPMLGSELLRIGPGACFLANAVSYLAVLLALLAMTAHGEPAPNAHEGGKQGLRDGVRYLRDNPRLALLVGLAGTMALCGWPFLTLLPALASKSLGLEAHGYSRLVSATGLGALIAALTVATFGAPRRQLRLITGGVWVVSAALVCLSLAGGLAVAALCCGFVGFGLILVLPTSQSVVQLSADDAHRGLVMGMWAMTLSGAVPLGSLAVGVSADWWGESSVLRLQALVAACAGLGVFALFWKNRQNPATHT